MSEGRYDPVESPVLEQAPGRTCRPVERGAHTGAGLLAGLVTPWKGPTVEQGKSVRRKERQRQCVMN